MKNIYLEPKILETAILFQPAVNASAVFNLCLSGPEGAAIKNDLCKGQINETDEGEIIFCVTGISNGSELNGGTFSYSVSYSGEVPNGCLSSQSSKLSECYTLLQGNNEGQINCDKYGGGVAVDCLITLDCSLFDPKCEPSSSAFSAALPGEEPSRCANPS